MCFDGPARTAAHELWCTTATTTTILRVPGSLCALKKRSYVAFLANRLGCIYYNRMPCANVGSKPWYRCGCRDDTPWRLGDACSMTFLPWCVTRTEPPVQLHEVGPDRGHLLTESCSDVHLHVCVDVEPGMRTAAAVAWEAAVKISLLVLALSLLDRGCCKSLYFSSTGCCSSTYCCCCCGRCSSMRRSWSIGSHPTESLVERNTCGSIGYWSCVSHGPKAAVPRNPDGERNKENPTINLNHHVSVRTCTF